MQALCDRFATLSRKEAPELCLNFDGDHRGSKRFVSVARNNAGFELRVDDVSPEFREDGGVRIRQYSPVRYSWHYNQNGFFVPATAALAGSTNPVYPHSCNRGDPILRLVEQRLQEDAPNVSHNNLSATYFCGLAHGE